ncbi:hypothetical protein [Amycolatopsis tolypomycina]|uniref:hypothetical protein n=1 Tax=Amycolatopsis tolypomycina TaxID=208445 RepID=UPI00115FF1B0|nr:hypothetical protein [Amycolatopsis tolypomycina]
MTRIEEFANGQGSIAALEVPSVVQPIGCTLDAAFHAAMAAFNATKAVDYQVAAKFARVAVHHGGFANADRNLSAAIGEDLSSEQLLAVRGDLG